MGAVDGARPGPLAGIRVVEVADSLPTGGRLLHELGAEVVLVEPPATAADPGRLDVRRAVEHAGKHSIVLDLDDGEGRQLFRSLIHDADVLLDGTGPGGLAARGFDTAALQHRHPSLVITLVSDFGHTGPRANWRGSNAVHLALSGVLARSGLPGRPPLLPPGDLADAAVAVQAAWATVLALVARERDGRSAHLDVSALESTMQLLDPPYGVGGTASMGSPEERTRDRPDVGHRYPIFPCADGWVRLAVLSVRQWQGLFTWLGAPAAFSDARYEQIGERFAARRELYPLIADLLHDRTRAELVVAAARHGVPLEPLLEPEETLDADHIRARGVFADRELAPGIRAPAPTGHVEIDDHRLGPAGRAPHPGEHGAEPLVDRGSHHPRRGHTTEPRAPAPGRPLEGVRVLDLGIIVAGAELGRIMADQGADVIKVENSRFLDGLRQAMGTAAMSANFARAHRNKRSVGIDLRRDEGRRLLLELAARSDVVVSNFKPGTLDRLGLPPQRFWEANPRLVLAESSALGHTGPWAQRLGYGPLVRAVTGCTRLWRYPDTDDYCDAMTVYPDHMAARISAFAIVSLLSAVRRGAPPGRITVAQSEVILNQLAPQLLAARLASRGVEVDLGLDAPQAVIPCAGNDDWLVVAVRGDADFRAVAAAIGRDDLASDEGLQHAAGRVRRASELEQAVAAWCRDLTPAEAAERLQARSIAAAPMLRREDLPDDDHLRARGFFDELHQPELDEPLLVERGPAHGPSLPDPEQRPAPQLGAHTREVLREIAGLDDARIDMLLASGVVEEPSVSAEASVGMDRTGTGASSP